MLSGADSDGALGLKAIKEEGGIAIVQDPATALFGEMPRSGILADHVDLILRPAEIAAELSRVARQFFQPSLQSLERGALVPEDEPHFAQILALVQSVSGVASSSYKPGTLRRRIARRMILKRFDSLSDYAQCLQGNLEELRNLQEELLSGVTRFFRDAAVFDTLKALIFPRLFENLAADPQVRLWIAGSSTSEEVYTIAICLLEYFAGQNREPPIQIFGTDASGEGCRSGDHGAPYIAGRNRELADERSGCTRPAWSIPGHHARHADNERASDGA